MLGGAGAGSSPARGDQNARICSRARFYFMPVGSAARDGVASASDVQGVSQLLPHRYEPASFCSGRGAKPDDATIWEISFGKSGVDKSFPRTGVSARVRFQPNTILSDLPRVLAVCLLLRQNPGTGQTTVREKTREMEQTCGVARCSWSRLTYPANAQPPDQTPHLPAQPLSLSPMVAPLINKFLARGAHHPRVHAAPGRVVAVKKLSQVGASFVGNPIFVVMLSSAFILPGMTVRILAEYDRGGAVILYGTSAPLELSLSKDQNRNLLHSNERGPTKIGDLSVLCILEGVACAQIGMIAARQIGAIIRQVTI